jgi:hypothetical protein
MIVSLALLLGYGLIEQVDNQLDNPETLWGVTQVAHNTREWLQRPRWSTRSRQMRRPR